MKRYKELGFELIDEDEMEWELVITDKTKVKEIAEKLNDKNFHIRFTCSIFENDNIATWLFEDSKGTGRRISIDELLNLVQ